MDDQASLQEKVLAFLGDPATHGGACVRRIDTHAASVFLAGDRALKVKRAVRFPFLDYSTLDKRHAACRAELDVNRPFAPALYRGVLPITRDADGQLALGGEGEIVEWAVEMRRFDENGTLDRIADARGIDLTLAEELAQAVVTMHSRAPPADADAWLSALTTYLEQNAEAFREHPALFPPDKAAALDRAAHACLERLRPLLAARGARGLVRRGHGDLHLGNIAMLDGHPVPFDAIEFDPVIASGDVLYDLAFLLMDLLERNLHAAANGVLNRYLADTDVRDLDGLAALPFFMALRAAIRAKVVAAQMLREGAAAGATLADRARAYFALAARLLAPVRPRLVAVGGLSGTGKSALARALAPLLLPLPGAVVVRSDVERKHLFHRVEHEPLPPEAYRVEVNSEVYARVMERAGQVVAAGHSAIADAVFARQEERAAIAQVAARHNVPFVGLYLVADLETRLRRVGARTRDASDADASVARAQERYALGTIDWLKIDASGTPEQTLQRAQTAIGTNAHDVMAPAVGSGARSS